MYEATPTTSTTTTPDPKPNTENESQQLTTTTTTTTTTAIQYLTTDEAIDQIGTGPFQRYILISAGLCFCSDAIEILLLSILSPTLQELWSLSANETASITSVVFAGAMMGTLCLGRMGDLYGRRPSYLVSAGLIAVCGLLTSLVGDWTWLVICRFGVGFGVGGATVPFDILAEFAPTSGRGSMLMSIEYFWTGGSLLVPVVGYWTVGKDGMDVGWRWFVVFLSVPCFLSWFFGMFFVPESPRWLVARGRGEEALDTLRMAAKKNGKDPDLLFPRGEEGGVGRLLGVDSRKIVLRDDQTLPDAHMLDLFKPKWRKLTLSLFGVYLAYAFGYYGTVQAITKIFEKNKNDNDNDDDDNHKIQFDYFAIFISSSAEIVGIFLVTQTIDRLGRVRSQVLSYIIGGISLFLLCMTAGTQHRIYLLLLSFITRIFEMTGSAVTWISTAEVLSTEIRTTGHSVANAMGRVGGFLSPYLISGVSHDTLWVVGVVMLGVHFMTAFCAGLLPETSGLGLEEIRRVAVGDGGASEGDNGSFTSFGDEEEVMMAPAPARRRGRRGVASFLGFSDSSDDHVNDD